MDTDTASTGGELLQYLMRNHAADASCVLCEADCSRTALVDLAYVFESCKCGTPEYTHLIERLQHRRGCP